MGEGLGSRGLLLETLSSNWDARMTQIVVWLVRDSVRLEDNPALETAIELALAADARLCALALLEPRRWTAHQWGMPRTGLAWQRFRLEGLCELRTVLSSYGMPLTCLAMDVGAALTAVQEHGVIQAVVTDLPVSVEESAEHAEITRLGHPVVTLATDDLFTPAQLPFDRADVPATFTRFRKAIETSPSCQPHYPGQRPSKWPQGIMGEHAVLDQQLVALHASAESVSFACHGGSKAGQAWWSDYLEAGALSHYKDTRNTFEGRHQSSRLSPWLAHGNLSVRQIWHDTLAYESTHGANESTYWLRFELLWREFFRWYARSAGHALFLRTGPADRMIAWGDGSMRWDDWTAGTTGEPIIDACQRELNATGWLSNRGRQLVASACLAHCAVDWRQGAAYLESRLVDFDVASNWGNWAYIAGVGPDPRGGRLFNLSAQADRYDPAGIYRARWLDR